jgi:hypothetical protein
MAQGFRYTEPVRNSPVDSDPVRTNFNALATCHCGTTAPTDPSEGWLWLDTSNPISYDLKMYISGSWLTILHNLQYGYPPQASSQKYDHTQAAAATTWNIIHTLGITAPCAAYYDTTNVRIYPDTETIISSNLLRATFSVAVAGRAVVVG